VNGLLRACSGVGIIIIWGGCAGWDAKDLTATLSAQACAGVKLDVANGEVDWSADVEVCAKGGILGLDLPDVCIGAGAP